MGQRTHLCFRKLYGFSSKTLKPIYLFRLFSLQGVNPLLRRETKCYFFKKKFDKISKHNELFHFIRCCLQQTVPSVCHISCQTGLHLFLHYRCIEHLSVSHLHNNHIIDHFKIWYTPWVLTNRNESEVSAL